MEITFQYTANSNSVDLFKTEETLETMKNNGNAARILSVLSLHPRCGTTKLATMFVSLKFRTIKVRNYIFCRYEIMYIYTFTGKGIIQNEKKRRRKN